MEIWIIYLDNIIIFAKEFEECQENIDLVLTRLMECNFKLSAEKCFFMQKSVHCVGHVVSDKGVETDPDKIEELKNWPGPMNTEELHCFIAFAGYYMSYDQHISKLAKPLTYRFITPTSRKEIQEKA